MQTHLSLAHLALNLSLGRKSRHRVDDNDVNRGRADKLLSDLKSLLTIVRLAHVEGIHIDTELLGIGGVERVLSVNESGNTTRLLSLGNGMDGERSLTRRLGAKDLNDTSARVASHSEGHIETERACRDDRNLLDLTVAHAHDGTLAVGLVNLIHGQLKSRQFFRLDIFRAVCHDML